MDANSTQDVMIDCGTAQLQGDLSVAPDALGLVMFAHGSGSGRKSARNRQVAAALQQARFGTLLFDLLTAEEERVDMFTREHRFDIPKLAARMVCAARWAARRPQLQGAPIGFFGASTGLAAALIAAAELGDKVAAVVSRGGRPDLAGDAVLRQLTCPTLLIVGGEDDAVIDLNRRAHDLLRGRKSLQIVPGATHLFEEPGALEHVAQLAAEWFTEHFASALAAREESC